jgi:hypothetical protein
LFTGFFVGLGCDILFATGLAGAACSEIKNLSSAILLASCIFLILV